MALSVFSRRIGIAIAILTTVWYVQAELRGQGAAAMIDNGPDDMARYMKSETDKWAKVINALGLRAQQTTTGG